MKKLEYLISILLSLALLEFGLFYALYWYWSGFPWSPLGHENCELEGVVFPIIVWPFFVLAELFRMGLLFRWKFPSYVWCGPLILCGIAATACFCNSLTMRDLLRPFDACPASNGFYDMGQGNEEN